VTGWPRQDSAFNGLSWKLSPSKPVREAGKGYRIRRGPQLTQNKAM